MVESKPVRAPREDVKSDVAGQTGDVARDLLTPTPGGHDTITYRQPGDDPISGEDADQTAVSESWASALDDQKPAG
jgi:hypothetical protein